jgi:hypothetical protein
MRTTIIFVSILLFVMFAASGFYSQYCYMQYRSLWPKGHVVGLLTGIRASLEFTHDPNDPNLSDECRMYFKKFKIAAMIAIVTTLLTFLFILLVRSFGLEEIMNQ